MNTAEYSPTWLIKKCDFENHVNVHTTKRLMKFLSFLHSNIFYFFIELYNILCCYKRFRVIAFLFHGRLLWLMPFRYPLLLFCSINALHVITKLIHGYMRLSKHGECPHDQKTVEVLVFPPFGNISTSSIKLDIINSSHRRFRVIALLSHVWSRY